MIGVIQARMGSKRLPGKMLAPIEGKPLFERLAERAAASRLCPRWVLSTATGPENLPLIRAAEALGMGWHAGSEEDLAQRLHATAAAFDADVIVKINGDCPLIDPAVIDLIIETYNETDPRADHVSNKGEWSFPMGQSVEVISTKALAYCDKHLVDPADRECVANYIMYHPELFDVRTVVLSDDYSAHAWMVDTAQDLEFVCRIFRALSRPDAAFSMHEILAYLEREHVPA